MNSKVISELIIREDMTNNNSQEKSFSGMINLTISTQEPLHIGSGELKIKTHNSSGLFVHEIIKHHNTPFITGSSIKGSIRTYMECLSPKLFLNNTNNSSSGHENNGCYFPIIENIYGTIKCDSNISRLFFSDFYLIEKDSIYKETKVTASFQPKSTEGIKIYTTETSEPLDKPKDLWIEFIPPGVELSGQAFFNDLFPYELGLLFYALQLNKLKIGGKKEKGFGHVSIKVDSITLYNKSKLSKDHILECNKLINNLKSSYEQKIKDWKIIQAFEKNLEAINAKSEF